MKYYSGWKLYHTDKGKWIARKGNRELQGTSEVNIKTKISRYEGK